MRFPGRETATADPEAETGSDRGAEPASTSSDQHFPCSQCGADLRYAPGLTRLTCSHCGHEQDIPGACEDTRSAALAPLDYHSAINAPLPEAMMEETRVTSCTSCGAQVEFDPNTHAMECPFCASPVVADTGTHRHIKPQAVLPFVLRENQAREALRTWLKSLWFAPNGLKQYARQDRPMSGLYVPYWAFDADTRSQYRGERGTHYYVTRTVNGKTRTERRTRWTPVSGSVARKFLDVLVMASQALPRKYLRGLEPWGLDQLQPYRPEFLSGFRAEGYSVGLEDGFVIARERMDEVIRQDVRRAIGGDAQRIHRVDTQTSEEMFKHLLLPVWMAAYRYRDKPYRIVVNAQTGRVQGERPWSIWKIAFAVLVAAILAGAAIYIFAMSDMAK